MPIGTTAAIIGAGVLGAGASAVAAGKNAGAIKESSDSSLQANREAIAAQERAFQQNLAFQQDALDKGLALQTDTLNANNALNAATFNRTGQVQTDIYNNNVGTLNPFVQTGYSAMNGINALLGLPQQKAYQPKQVAFNPIDAPVVAPRAPVPDTSASATQQASLAGTPTNADWAAFNAGTAPRPTYPIDRSLDISRIPYGGY